MQEFVEATRQAVKRTDRLARCHLFFADDIFLSCNAHADVPIQITLTLRTYQRDPQLCYRLSPTNSDRISSCMDLHPDIFLTL